MRVLIYGLNYAPEPVGIGKYSGELGSWLARQNHQIRVITAPPYFPRWHAEGNRFREERLAGAIVWRCPIWVPRRPSGITRLIHLASFALSSFPALLWQWRWRPEIIICVAPTIFCAPGALMLKQMCGAETLAWLHIQDFEIDAAFELGLLKGKVLRTTAERLERWLLGSFERVSSISETMRKRAICKGVKPDRTELVTNWIDLNEIKPLPENERQNNPYRNRLGITSDKLILLYSGSINKKQGMEILADAIIALREREELVWIIAGEGPGKAEIVEATKGLPQVRHLGLQPSECMNDWLNMADVHLLPQRAGATDLVLPSKVIGMLASGRPLVATSPAGSELGKLAELVGRRTDPEDAIKFAEAVIDLTGNKEERMRLGRRGRQYAEEHYDMDKVLTNLELKCELAVRLKRGATGGRHIAL